MKTKKKSNKEIKKEHWAVIKKEFMKFVPKKYKVILSGIDDDSEYYHPTIEVNDNIRVTSQASTGHNNVYAIRVSTKFKIDNVIHSKSIDFYEYSDLLEFLENDFVQNIAENILDTVKDLENQIEVIKDLQENLLHNEYFRDVKNEKLKVSSRVLKNKLENLIINM